MAQHDLSVTVRRSLLPYVHIFSIIAEKHDSVLANCYTIRPCSRIPRQRFKPSVASLIDSLHCAAQLHSQGHPVSTAHAKTYKNKKRHGRTRTCNNWPVETPARTLPIRLHRVAILSYIIFFDFFNQRFL